MLKRFSQLRQKKQAQNLIDSLKIWYDTGRRVTKLLTDVLYDESICEAEIGVTLDKADRMLMAFRSESTDARGALHRQDKALAQRLEQATQDIYQLRNETARFLIRCQGPGPLWRKDSEADPQQKLYYYRALEDVGFNARHLSAQVNQDLETVWRDLQFSIQQAEETAAS